MRALLLTFLLALPAAAEEVDVELVLLADTTGSIDDAEAFFQRQSYAGAITDPRVLTAIASTMTGRIAVTYVEWAAEDAQVVVVAWAVIEGSDSTRGFAEALMVPPRMANGTNAIGAALLAGRDLIEGNDIDGIRKVIDFSGDSANNRRGPPLAPAREAVLAAGIIINALAVLCRDRSGQASYDLVGRCEDEIIGGAGAFVIAAESPETFTEAVVRKLVLEIATLP
jgi:Protein of unknown function (DUF1194)